MVRGVEGEKGSRNGLPFPRRRNLGAESFPLAGRLLSESQFKAAGTRHFGLVQFTVKSFVRTIIRLAAIVKGISGDAGEVPIVPLVAMR